MSCRARVFTHEIGDERSQARGIERLVEDRQAARFASLNLSDAMSPVTSSAGMSTLNSLRSISTNWMPFSDPRWSNAADSVLPSIAQLPDQSEILEPQLDRFVDQAVHTQREGRHQRQVGSRPSSRYARLRLDAPRRHMLDATPNDRRQRPNRIQSVRMCLCECVGAADSARCLQIATCLNLYK